MSHELEENWRQITPKLNAVGTAEKKQWQCVEKPSQNYLLRNNCQYFIRLSNSLCDCIRFVPVCSSCIAKICDLDARQNLCLIYKCILFNLQRWLSLFHQNLILVQNLGKKQILRNVCMTKFESFKIKYCELIFYFICICLLISVLRTSERKDFDLFQQFF
ncbi:hypothetical protein KUTeg_008229 [Tegillarca granosa]|uniref:Uncharacterized protein n=1 Tax=Tegillarca granosa TaxID=220873 RepID=A0ABQ9F8I3_TEGGR|nr:hypothetical protein KUTeg_008229 [Tegillarca granosa]